MKVLVTGGSGFIGRHLVWRLAAEGCEVLFSGRNAQAAAEVMALSPAPVRWLALDHGSPQAEALLADASRGCDAMVHCAALSSPWGSPQAFAQANLDSTAEVINACRVNQVRRLVHLSTPSLYFDFRDRLGIREDQPLPPPVNDYARSKAQAEVLLGQAGLDECVILRPRAVFGPWDATLMPRLLRVMQRGAIPLMRGGRAQLDLTCVDNLVQAVWLALTRPLPRALCIYNLSNGTPLSFKELLEKMARQFDLPLRTRRLPWPLVHAVAHLLELKARLGNGDEPLITRYGAGVLAFSQTLDISAIQRELGYRPVISQEQGIAQHAQWWLAQQRQQP
ncbi:NAD(P)-dependent oxidoreductase [Pseudomonas sp. CF161]|jgi:nucleoside-diphosphate-sugar epimerase|uniref:NAD-dependent epimerase/dehydratase family protein n=1 Tax=Pseudomonas sp. CF161 TaxID=911241 RepID=UPI0003553075|nr:NAD(P)-dependent oxidoreductase [Pseudomonas sp. CF161]EPL06624.1 putative 3-beta hydroxysteroid dehydrogenase/isomerase family protein [Pseudomonas sp. CF161]